MEGASSGEKLLSAPSGDLNLRQTTVRLYRASRNNHKICTLAISNVDRKCRSFVGNRKVCAGREDGDAPPERLSGGSFFDGTKKKDAFVAGVELWVEPFHATVLKAQVE